MDLKRYNDSPVRTRISFHVIIERLKKVAEEGAGFRSERARQVLTRVAPHNVLYHGTTDPDILIEHEDLIAEILADIFPAMLSDNEIKGITVPFQNILLNPTNRLQRILQEAGSDFNLAIRGYNHHQFYVNTCCLILNTHYGANFNFNRSLFYDIPNAQGIMKHYRILYNTDFMELSPTDKAVDITSRDIEILRDNFDNLELWKKYFPEDSWNYKGFAIVNLFDATLENAVSALKGTLLGSGYGTDLQCRMLQVFRSVYRIPDLDIGFASFDKAENKFSFNTFSPGFKSYLLKDEKEEECIVLLKLVQQQKYVAISNIAQLLYEEPGNGMLRRLADQGIQSIILSPVVKNGHQLGIIELVSSKTGELNSINANQLEIMMPYITDAFERQYNFMQSQIQALIQNEYTTIHPSVCWKFRKEALRALLARAAQSEYTLKSVRFSAVTPLYGQIDVKGSSDKRNSSVQLDLLVQLIAVVRLLHHLPADLLMISILKSAPCKKWPMTRA
ncbi:GAF domain-containing protein [Mucilaginibacter endophyticus]|uniref:GAF domain-containing protein n=1 Tax=Mucilaginibacter endophyticus TaxID=2675003 RepID=UPI000E0DDD9D|nr:GAF domain-containing protein [Mucilaginibacter endophyticus]